MIWRLRNVRKDAATATTFIAGIPQGLRPTVTLRVPASLSSGNNEATTAGTAQSVHVSASSLILDSLTAGNLGDAYRYVELSYAAEDAWLTTLTI